MDIVERLAEHIANTTYEDLPEEIIWQTKKEILDVIGCELAGLDNGDVHIIKKALRSYNKNTPTASSVQAIMWMVAAARTYDYDPVNDETGDHPPIATVLSGLLVPLISGTKVSGRQLITAAALGEDLVLRIRKGTPQRLGEHPWIAGTFAPFIAAATTGKLLGLDKEQIRNALGLAFTVCSNTAQGLREGTNSYKAHHGWAIRAGIESAFMAAAGMVGVQAMLEGQYGFYQVYHSGKYDRDYVIDRLGEYYHNVNVGFKIYPCCRLMQGSIDAGRKVRQEHNLRPEDIQDITIRVNQSAYVLCGKMPWYKPRQAEDLRFSIPYGVALGFLEDVVGMRHFSDEAVDNEAANSLASRVTVYVDEELNKHKSQLAPTLISVRLKSGQVIEDRIEAPIGHPSKPLKMEELHNKFRDNVSWSRLLSENAANELLERIMNLEQMEDTAELCPVLWQHQD